MSDAPPVPSPPPSYPVAVDVEPQLGQRNRVTTAFRLILAVPHIIIVGGLIGFGFGIFGLHAAGALASAALAMAFVSWFAVVFTGRQPQGLWDFESFYMRWRIRVQAYIALLRDDYPPFGDAEYPTVFEVASPTGERNRVTVGFRLILAIPHAIVLLFINIAWLITTIIAWFAIVFTGRYPEGLYRFGVGAMRWNVRVETYVLLMRDEYPPFRLAP